MSAEAFARHAARAGRCELINGDVVPLSPTGARHGDYTSRLHYFITHHVYQNDLGKVFASETGFRLDGDEGPTVRAPDIAFIARERAAAADTSKFCPIPPDLAVETLSPRDTASYMSEKVQWWLARGARQVWIVDPENDTTTVHQPGGHAQILHAADTLEGGDVLPGFSLPLAQLFT